MKNTKLLVIVDMQNDFITGPLAAAHAAIVTANVIGKIKRWDGDFAVTLDTHSDNYLKTQEGRMLPVKHCIRDTEGWRLQPDVFNALLDKMIHGAKVEIYNKYSFGCPDLVDLCACYEEITFIGVCTDICVISNALLVKSFCPEATLTIDADCCSGTSDDNHEAALKIMRANQIGVIKAR